MNDCWAVTIKGLGTSVLRLFLFWENVYGEKTTRIYNH
nr:MAG TPA: hypothetical protein [Caudoviricetes sp.]